MTLPTPLFPLGAIAATRGAITLLEAHELSFDLFLVRHASGDWGDIDAQDADENQLSLRYGWRIWSRYSVGSGHLLWVITEADRSVTTLLLPEEY